VGDKRIALTPNRTEARRIAVSLPTFWVLIGASSIIMLDTPDRAVPILVLAVPAVLVALFTASGIFIRETGRSVRQMLFPYSGLNPGDSFWRLQTDIWKAQFRMMTPGWFMSVARATEWNHRVIATVFVLSLLVGLAGIVYNWSTF
jgi:hypothetical protein